MLAQIRTKHSFVFCYVMEVGWRKEDYMTWCTRCEITETALLGTGGVQR